MNAIWYHGTASGDIVQFRPFTHFGDLVAAHHACAMKYRGPFIPIPPLLNDARIIKVAISTSEDTIYYAKEDWGTPNAAGLASIIAEDSDFSEEIREKARKIRKMISSLPKSVRGDCFSIVESFYDELNIKAIVYSNAVENSNGEKSICVVDPAIISHVGSSLVSEREIEVAFSKTLYARAAFPTK